MSQVRSKNRVNDHGEVFTSEKEVNDMLDMVKQETERIDSRFLEPACGNGNFLAEVLRRKLSIVEERYRTNQLEFELYAVIAISSLYGLDILEDNAKECRARLFEIFNERYTRLFKGDCKEECRNSVDFLLNRNILCGDALDFTNPVTKEPIVFSEWSVVNRNMLKRRDFAFRLLVDKGCQLSLFDDEGNQALINEPVKNYPLCHFLKLAENV